MFAYLCVCRRPLYQKVYDHYPHVRFHTSLPFSRLKHLPRRDQLHLSWSKNPERRSPLMPERVSFWQSFLKKLPELRCRGGSAFNFIATHKNPTFRLRSGPSHLRCWRRLQMRTVRAGSAKPPVLTTETRSAATPVRTTWSSPVRRRWLLFFPGNKPLQPVRATTMALRATGRGFISSKMLLHYLFLSQIMKGCNHTG